MLSLEIGKVVANIPKELQIEDFQKVDKLEDGKRRIEHPKTDEAANSPERVTETKQNHLQQRLIYLEMENAEEYIQKQKYHQKEFHKQSQIHL